MLCRLVDILPGEVRGIFLKDDVIIHRFHDNTIDDYIWNFVCSLKGANESSEIDLTELANRVWDSIKKREYIEKRHTSIEDDGLVGMLSFMCNILKYDNVFKFSKQGMEAVDQVRIIYP